MLARIKTSLCHPRYIGLFFKDKFHRIILFVLFFFMLFSAGIITKCMLTDQFGYEQANAMQTIIQYSTDSDGKKPTLNIKFDSSTKKITGDSMNFNSDSAYIGFMPEKITRYQNKLTVYFTEDTYYIFYGYYELGKGNYNNSDLRSFDVSKVQTGDIENCSNFKAFLVNIFDNVQNQEALVIAFQSIISNFVYYILVLILCLLNAYFLNPSIQFNVRMKLVLYDSVSYFYWYIIALLIGVTWIEYIALIVPFIFTSITFSHIKRIR